MISTNALFWSKWRIHPANLIVVAFRDVLPFTLFFRFYWYHMLSLFLLFPTEILFGFYFYVCLYCFYLLVFVWNDCSWSCLFYFIFFPSFSAPFQISIKVRCFIFVSSRPCEHCTVGKLHSHIRYSKTFFTHKFLYVGRTTLITRRCGRICNRSSLRAITLSFLVSFFLFFFGGRGRAKPSNCEASIMCRLMSRVTVVLAIAVFYKALPCGSRGLITWYI